MSESLARFRELKGVGPAIEARLHEAGVFTWEALSQVMAALGSVRSATGEAFQDLSARITEQASAGASGPRPPNAERNEAFIARIALAGGEPIRSTITHVRTQTEKSSAGWSGDEVIRFIEEHADIAPTAAPAAAAPARRPSQVHVAVLDAGKVIGGASRDIELVLAADQVGGVQEQELDYQATLCGRPFGQGGKSSAWTILARQAGRVSVSDHLPLRFTAVALPPGLQRLRVEVGLRLPAASEDGPKLALA
jgi:hypothetical protein